MLSSLAALVLGLATFLPIFTLADPNPPPQSAEVFWRWKDEGNSNPTDEKIFTGHATITWVRSAGCQTEGASKNWHPTITPGRVDVTAVTKNGSGDYMDPKSVYHWPHGKDSSNGGCNAHSRTDFWVHNKARTQRMLIRLPDICNDHDCKGPSKERPNVQCLLGPKGRIVAYLGKWIDPCFEQDP